LRLAAQALEETVIPHSKLRPILWLEFREVVSASTDQTSILSQTFDPICFTAAKQMASLRSSLGT
jgi:hypothetical protein